MSGEVPIRKRRGFKVSPKLNDGEEINFIDFNKRMSPLSRILGKDKCDAGLSFRSQTKLIKGKSGRTSPGES